MNIFFLHIIPSVCAKYHCDKHVVKMILETAQLLCSAHHLHPKNYNPQYKLTHKNHPSAIWTRQSINNYKWLAQLGIELCKEYTYRYNKIHKCEQYIKEMNDNIPNLPDLPFTQPLLAMPDIYKDKDAIESYRHYYFFEKNRMLKWKNRNIPEWIISFQNMFI